MPAFSPPVTIERPRSGQGGGVNPPGFGGGDGDHGDGFPDFDRQLYRARLGLILGIVSISVLFVTVTAVFIFLRQSTLSVEGRTSTYLREWTRVALPIRLLLVNTFVLLLSSLTIEKARRAVNREMVLAPVRAIPGIAFGPERGMPWVAITVALGLLFLAGQWIAWQILLAHGFSVHSSKSSSFVYILTAAHAVHLSGGILVLLYAGVIAWLHQAIQHRRIVVEIASWYWHFMGVLWIYIFALLQMAR